jgi:hypothetical protein
MLFPTEVPVYFLKMKQGYTVRIMETDKWIRYILISAGMKFRNRKKFRYGTPAHFEHWSCSKDPVTKESVLTSTEYPLLEQTCVMTFNFDQLFTASSEMKSCLPLEPTFHSLSAGNNMAAEVAVDPRSEHDRSIEFRYVDVVSRHCWRLFIDTVS